MPCGCPNAGGGNSGAGSNDNAADNGIKVIIAAAGMAAHLAGSLAARTALPIIGVPLAASASPAGLDALLSTVQMPPGIPVATVAIGKAGAKNAAILAIQIMALSDDALATKLANFRAAQTKKVIEKFMALHDCDVLPATKICIEAIASQFTAP